MQKSDTRFADQTLMNACSVEPSFVWMRLICVNGFASRWSLQKTVLTSLLRLIMDARVKPGHDAECVALACANVNRPP